MLMSALSNMRSSAWNKCPRRLVLREGLLTAEGDVMNSDSADSCFEIQDGLGDPKLTKGAYFAVGKGIFSHFSSMVVGFGICWAMSADCTCW